MIYLIHILDSPRNVAHYRLYGSENLDLTVSKRIVTETLRFIKDSKRFDP